MSSAQRTVMVVGKRKFKVRSVGTMSETVQPIYSGHISPRRSYMRGLSDGLSVVLGVSDQCVAFLKKRRKLTPIAVTFGDKETARFSAIVLRARNRSVELKMASSIVIDA